ncbi:MAG: hypothetical protein LRY51_11375 [Geovibrio sp.]|nr:hypothetical protein [Geovibrio sp.]
MGRLDTVIKENRDLKDELEKLITLVRENEAKHGGFRIVEYAFLLSNSLAEITEKPLSYLAEIFDIDRAVLFLNSDALDLSAGRTNLADKISSTRRRSSSTSFWTNAPTPAKTL